MSKFLLFNMSLMMLLPFTSVSQNKPEDKKAITELNNKANIYLDNLQFKESLLLSREALKRAIALKDDMLIATAYNTIAGNYDELSDNNKAIKNYKVALFHASRTNDDTLIGLLNNNLGNMYFFENKDYDLGLKYYNKSLEYAQKTSDTSRMVFTRLNMALAYFEIHQYDNGFPHLQFVNQHQSTFGDQNNIVYVNMLNGIYYGSKNKFDEAESYFKKAIALAKSSRLDLDLTYVYQEYSRFLQRKGDHQNAYKYLALYDELKDSIYDTHKLRSAEVEGINLELDEYKRAVQRIEAEKEVQATSLQKSQIIVIMFVVMVLILSLLLHITYRNYLYRKHLNSELTAANEQLRLAKEKAEEASQLKTQFVSTISHELRTPLYGVVGITNMILDEHQELADSPHLTSLKFSAKYLLSLVNDILQINKIEEKRLVLESMIFNVADELNTVKNSLQFIATRNQNLLITEIDPAIPEFLIGDKLRLSQIFMNLISNALKFTNKGQVKIKADLVQVDGNSNYIKFEVSDTGIGIAKEDQAKIFEKFVQIERKEDDYQGTGLGLAIVSRLIDLFGSKIELRSAAGEGTTFSFTIGFEHNLDKASEIIKNIEVDLSSSQIFKVLVVEDSKINQIVTRKIIEKNNYKCSVVEDGLSAIKLLQKKQFDVILMDINMPVINGFETTRRLRAMGIETPIVALTAFDKEEIAEEAISAGMNDIIIKPFEPVKLFQAILGQINKKSAV